jgi:hypothetical protein
MPPPLPRSPRQVAGEGGWDAGHRWTPQRVLLDPYAPLVAGRRRFGVRDAVEGFKGKVRRGPGRWRHMSTRGAFAMS